MAPHPSPNQESGFKEPLVRPIRILVTGFGPFQSNFPINPSFEITKSLPHYLPITPAHKVPVQILSHYTPIRVAYKDVRALIPQLLQSHIGAIDLVLHIGMASGRQYYTMEKHAHRDGYDCNKDLDSCVVSTAESSAAFADVGEVLTTGLEFEEVFQRWRANVLGSPGVSPLLDGVDVRRSDNAGYYLCDYTYFNSLAWFARRGAEVGDRGGGEESRPAMFLHIPAESGGDMIEKGRLVALALIRAMADSFAEDGRSFEIGEQQVERGLLSGSRGSTVV